MPTVQCKQCNNDFYAKPSWLKKGYGKYCSRACQNVGARKGKEVVCSTCKTKTYKSPKALNGSKSGKYFCNKSCQTKWRNIEFSREKHPNWKTGMYSYKSVLLRSGRKQSCVLCETEDTRVLAVHHIDEDRTNNTVENLAWLCHNCHHLVHHDKAEYKKFMAAIV